MGSGRGRKTVGEESHREERIPIIVVRSGFLSSSETVSGYQTGTRSGTGRLPKPKDHVLFCLLIAEQGERIGTSRFGLVSTPTEDEGLNKE